MGSETDLADVLRSLSKEPIDAVVDNAGISLKDPVETIGFDAFRNAMEINVRAPLQIVQALVPGMKARRFDRVVNVTSRAQLGLRDFRVYAATKAALSSMGKSWALELGGFGVTVNAIAPGPIETELFWGAMPKDSDEAQTYLKTIPVQRIGQPQEIAATVIHLLQKDAGFITGQTIFACGGLTVGRAAN